MQFDTCVDGMDYVNEITSHPTIRMAFCVRSFTFLPRKRIRINKKYGIAVHAHSLSCVACTFSTHLETVNMPCPHPKFLFRFPS